MKTRNIAPLALVLLATTLIACPTTEPPDPMELQEPLVVFLVRHAEKANNTSDPPLTAAGHDRAGALARALRSARLDHVHSSDYIRTRDTAAPTAADQELDVELYDPSDLAGLADALLEAGGRHLVVGHSNTTPSVVALLGGDPESAIDEGDEYDRLYVVTVGPHGYSSSALMRYGSGWQIEEE